ncbi:MAG: hypothetical protein HY275_04035 [Gemmatimonadetes bacterium]|nr:hypothetical protein [Gemmatimonadota bacterium]
MTAPGGGLLDFFVLEAGECLESLDALLARSDARPATDALLKDARRLRGSATMAKLGGFADVAGALERVARALHEDTLAWGTAVRASLIGAVDDLKVLLHRVRDWGAVEQAKARARAAELEQLAPAAARPAAAPAVGALGTAFLALETDELAMGVAGVRSRPADATHRDAVLQRVRRLRGIAALKDLPPMPEIVEGIERALLAIERAGGSIGEVAHEVLASATDVLVRAGTALKAGTTPAATGPEISRFAAAVAAWESEQTDGDRIVPIATLFYDDEGPHILERNAEPPSTPHQRFRLEVVSLAEHLRRFVAEARAAHDIVSRDRVARELRSAVRTLMNHAESFAETAVAKFAQRALEGVGRLDSGHLNQVDEVATLLAHAGGDPISRISAILNAPPPDQPQLRPPTPAAPSPTISAADRPIVPIESLAPVGAGYASPIVPIESLAPAGEASLVYSPPGAGPKPTPAAAPVVAAAPVAPPTPAPTTPPDAASRTPAARPIAAPSGSGLRGDALRDVLSMGLAGLGRLDTEPLAPPAIIEDDTVVPIEDLEYRGRAALDRALEIRDAIRARAGQSSPEEMDELFALLELVGAE